MNDKVQPLGLTGTDMIDQATVDALNAEVREVLASGEAQVYADVALRQVGDKHGMVVADTTSASDTDGGYVELWRLPDGRYTAVRGRRGGLRQSDPRVGRNCVAPGGQVGNSPTWPSDWRRLRAAAEYPFFDSR